MAKVLIACEFSGVVREAFRARGHDAISCDLLPTELPGPHFQGDVRPLLRERWDLVIGFPPCTYLSRAGARFYVADPTRKPKLRHAAKFLLEILNANSECAAVENPRMLRDGIRIIGRGPDAVVQPWMFGDPWIKTTCLWLRRLKSLVPTHQVKPTGSWIRATSKPGRLENSLPNRGVRNARDRGRSFPGMADAMAEQWGGGVFS